MSVRRTALVLAVAALLCACSGGSSETAARSSVAASSTESSAAPTTTTPPTTLSDEEAVKAAYLAYWTMVDDLFAHADSLAEGLTEVAVEPLLASVRDNLDTKRGLRHLYVLP